MFQQFGSSASLLEDPGRVLAATGRKRVVPVFFKCSVAPSQREGPSSLHLEALDLLPAAFQPLLAQDTSPKSPAAPLAADGPRRQDDADGVNSFLKNDVHSSIKISSLN